MDNETDAIEPTADETAYAAMEKEFGDTPADPPEDPPAEPKSPNVDEVDQKADAEKPPLPYEELEKRYGNLNGALAESRATQRALKEQLANMQQVFQQVQAQRQAPQQQPDDQFIDPLEQQLGLLSQQVTSLTEAQKAERDRVAQQAEHQQMLSYVKTQEAQFAQAQPDYQDAVDHLRTARMSELEIMIPDGDENAIYQAMQSGYQSPAQMRQAILSQEAQNILHRAYQANANPAALVYQLAQSRGYQKAQQQQQMHAVKQARQNAPESLSAGGASSGPSDGYPTMDELAELYVTDPDKADETFNKMKRAGLLG